MAKLGLVVVMIFFILPLTTFAQPPNPFIPEIGQSAISPASPLYFLKMVKESVEWKLAQTERVMFMRQMEFSIRRLREVKTLISEDREDLVEPNLIRYRDDHLQKMEGLAAQRKEELKPILSDRVTTDMNLLMSLYPSLKNSRAKLAVRATIETWELKNRSACLFLAKEATNSALTQSERYLIDLKAKEC